MGNSPLVNYTRLSPCSSGERTHPIDTVTIHCVVGQASVEALGSLFATPGKAASSNYGIGSDGRIGMYVPEDCVSWCSSNQENDKRAVTIEVASDNFHPYAVNDAAYNALICLLADICKRNGIKRLVWSEKKEDRVQHRNGCNMTVHRDYANKACPGDWLYSRHGQIASEVNKMLEEEEDMTGEVIYQKLIAYLASLQESEWSVKEGHFAKAKSKGITDGTMPRNFLTREQLFAILGRMGLLK